MSLYEHLVSTGVVERDTHQLTALSHLQSLFETIVQHQEQLSASSSSSSSLFSSSSSVSSSVLSGKHDASTPTAVGLSGVRNWVCLSVLQQIGLYAVLCVRRCTSAWQCTCAAYCCFIWHVVCVCVWCVVCVYAFVLSISPSRLSLRTHYSCCGKRKHWSRLPLRM
jgi:hypothetical protein